MRALRAPTTTAARAWRTASSPPRRRASGGPSRWTPPRIAELGLGRCPRRSSDAWRSCSLVTSHWHIFPDAYPALGALKERGLIVGAVSNWVWQLPSCSTRSTSSGTSTSSPPAPASATRSRTRDLRVGPRAGRRARPKVIHVGDHLDADVEGARSVGIGGCSSIAPDATCRSPGRRAGHPTLDELLPIVDARLDRVTRERALALLRGGPDR